MRRFALFSSIKTTLSIGLVGFSMLAQTAFAQGMQPFGLRIVQSVINPSSPSFTVDSKSVPIAFGASNIPASVDRDGTTTNHTIQIPVLNYGFGERGNAEILAAARNIMTPSRGQDLGNDLKKFIAEGKFNSGVFLFNQDIRPRGTNRDMRLVWMVTVTDDGRVFVQNPKIVDPDPTVVYMFYTSSNVDDALPQHWKHDGAGMLMWQVRKQDGTALTDYVTIDTGGAFNTIQVAADDGSGVTSDDDFMPNCLANRAFATACPIGFPDAATLMNDTSSTSAIIDYARKVSPVYQEVAGLEADEIDYRPIFSLSVDSREYHRQTCAGGSYRNAGRKGFLLETAVDRYMFSAGLDAVLLVNRYSKQDVSPTENFDVSINVDHTETGLRQMIVDPFENGKLAGLGDYPEIKYVAPLRNTNTVTTGNNIRITSAPGDSPAAWRSVTDTHYQLHFGAAGDNQWGFGQHDRSLVFNISNKNFFTEFYLSHIHFNDWMSVSVNGVLVYVGPRGGDRLNLISRGGGSFSSRRSRVENCSGCRNAVAQGQTSSSTRINVLPHLRNGSNTITVRTIVNSSGEGRIRFDAISCLEN